MSLTRFQSQYPEHADELARHLDDLLQDFQVYHTNVRSLRWNRHLRPFLELGPKLGLLDRVTLDNTDTIAEHLIGMGYAPQSRMNTQSQGLVPSRVKLIQPSPQVVRSLEDLINSSLDLLRSVHEVLHLAQDLRENTTMELMTRFSMQLRFAIHAFTLTRLALQN